MKTAADLTPRPEARKLVTREDILTLATFCDQNANAVSFYFSDTAVPDNAHREEKLAIKGLVQKAIDSFAPESAPAHLSKDLEEILAVAEEIRLKPNRLRVVFACGNQNVRQEFDLPTISPQSFLRVGRRFHLAPLMLALQSMVPYCVVILESGKSRAFTVRGTEIQEVPGRLAIEDLSLHAQDSRVGWSSHIDRNQVEHEKAYFKNLLHQLREFMSEHQTNRLVVGCREDLWGEIEPQFADLEKGVLMGRFHLPNFAVYPVEVLRRAIPVFDENQRTRVKAVLREINETSSRGALGVNDVLQTLVDGSAQKLVLGRLPDQTISECKSCGRMMAAAGHDCIFCGNAEVYSMAAEEGLIRQALLTDVEILFAETDTGLEFNGAAALLRY